MSRSNSSKLFSSKSARGSKRSNQAQLELVGSVEPMRARRVTPTLKPKNEKQAEYISSILTNTITIGVGSSGSGKTYASSALACQELEAGRIEKIIITRPNVEAEGSLGHLPGELETKYAPYLYPYMEVFHEFLGKTKTEYYIKRGIIEAVPLGFMRGRSFINAMVLADEMQNATVSGFFLVLSRIGKGSTLVLNGDPMQSDIRGVNGLVDAMDRLQGVDGLNFVEFTKEDIVRSGIVQDIVERYER